MAEVGLVVEPFALLSPHPRKQIVLRVNCFISIVSRRVDGRHLIITRIWIFRLRILAVTRNP